MKSLVKMLFSLRCLDQRISEKFSLEKKKLIIGSAENCDIRLIDSSISSYHAFILIQDEGILIKDLCSESGIYLNGRRQTDAFVNVGDTLTVGTLSFMVEGLESDIQVIDPDQSMNIQPKTEVVELPPREGLIFIDGDYCDIQFDDSVFKPLTSPLEMRFERNFVELEESQGAVELNQFKQDQRLEIISYVNGLMMDVSFVELRNGDYYLNPQKKSKFDILFHTLPKTKLFSIRNGNFQFFSHESLNYSKDPSQIYLSDGLFITHGSEQLSIRLVNKGISWKGLPLFYRDREFLKQGGKVFAGLFLPLLLLLFISVPEPEEVKQEIAVVYKLPDPLKKATEAQEKSDLKSENVTSKVENTGHKETQQPNQKVEFAAATQNQKVQAKNQAQAAAAEKSVTAPVKAYSFNSSVAMNAFEGSAPKLNANGAGKSNLKDTTFNAGTDDGSLVAGSNIGVSKFNGADKSGSGSGSYGSRGLANKSGFDSSYLEPKTVVLGSMDPELLRKILREYIPQFRHCYQQELIANSDKIKGIIDLNFTIDASGRVAKHSIKAKDARFSQKGIGCMGQVLSLIDFPRPKGGGVVDVRQPLNFFAETEKI
ncbi:MAG: FHA domain-containing protein [Bacteriovoracaceae bacterium]